MKSLFSQLTTLALRFRAITLALVVLVSIAGIIAVTQLKQELIPSVEFPQTIILARSVGHEQRSGLGCADQAHRKRA